MPPSEPPSASTAGKGPSPSGQPNSPSTPDSRTAVIDLERLRLGGPCGAPPTRLTCPTRPTGPAASAAAAEIRLQQVRQRVHVAEFSVLHAEQVRVGRAAAAVGAAGAEGAEHHDRPERLVDDEAAVGDVHAARHADVAAVSRGSVAGVHAAFRAVARIAPRYEVLLPFQKGIEVRVGGGDQRAARVAAVGGNGIPLLAG